MILSPGNTTGLAGSPLEGFLSQQHSSSYLIAHSETPFVLFVSDNTCRKEKKTVKNGRRDGHSAVSKLSNPSQRPEKKPPSVHKQPSGALADGCDHK